MNPEQRDAFDKIISAVDDSESSNKCFFLEGPAGSGKTFLFNKLITHFETHRQVVLPFAVTAMAATLLKGGQTVHSGFWLPWRPIFNYGSSMKPDSQEATISILQDAKLIIIDGISMFHKEGIEAIDILMKEITNNSRPFGGKVFVVGGDFRQLLPINFTSIRESTQWIQFKYLTLTTNMRSENHAAYNEWLLNVGIGGSDRNINNIPEQMLENDLISTIFGNVHQMSFEELSKRVILTPTNKRRIEINQRIINSMPGEGIIYKSEDLKLNIEKLTEDFDKTSSYMQDELHLKKGVIIIMLKNQDPVKGLCNGTRLVVEELEADLIKAKILSECNHGETVSIHREVFDSGDSEIPFKRYQFPVIPAHAITIHKSQGLTFDHVGIDLSNCPANDHGQFYVALSRSRSPEGIKIKYP